MMPFNDNVKSQALRRAGGLCECRRKDHRHLFGRCMSLVTRNSADFHHKHAAGQGGGDSLSNCEVLCRSCHKKTDSYGRR